MKNSKALFKLKNSTSLVMLLVTLLTITINLSSCSSKDDSATRTRTTALVNVYVRDGLDKKINGATVTLKQSGQNNKSGTTDAEGKFVFTDIPAGTISIDCAALLLLNKNVTATVTSANDIGLVIVMEGDETIKTLIPDPKFEEALIQQGFDTAPVDGSVPTYKINRATKLAVGGITDLTGIQDFKALETLYCANEDATATAKLTSLDLSKNTALKSLYCFFNNITSLDLSKNLALTTLRCNNNLLTTLDLSSNINLTELLIFNNPQLTALNVSKNTALKSLYYHNCTSLVTVDLSKNTALEALGCYDNKLTTLDVSKNIALKYLECYNNQLATLDVSNNKALRFLDCYSNKLTTLDVNNNTALIYFACSFNKLTTLDVSKNTALGVGSNAGFYCSDNLLTTLNFKNGNNINLVNGKANFKNNVSGLVIAVDDVAYSKTNWGSYKDAGAIYVSSF
jgi:hypothetical protein